MNMRKSLSLPEAIVATILTIPLLAVFQIFWEVPLVKLIMLILGPGGLIIVGIIVFCQEFKKSWQEYQKKYPTSTVCLIKCEFKEYDVDFDPLD